MTQSRAKIVTTWQPEPDVPTATLLVRSADRTGIVAALSDFVFRYGGNIIDAGQHSEDDRFFMRLVWSLEGFALDREGVQDALNVLARGFEAMEYKLFFNDNVPQVALFCSKEPHCLYDLLLRQKMSELDGKIALVVSNHEELADVSRHFDVPFFHIPCTVATRENAEAQQRQLLQEYGINLIVLAKYMQIISPEFCEAYAGHMINIHHSFLPAFVGAKPYHQAKERGVKIIGATAHYVTPDLDQGPIIAQDVTRVGHADRVEDLVRKGRDIERQVLGRAVRAHLQRKVLIDGGRTIVFE